MAPRWLTWELKINAVALASAAVIVLVAFMAIFAPLVSTIVGHDPNTQYRDTGLSPAGMPVGPSSRFLFGTDELGRDVFVRIFYGARVSLLAGVAASLLAVAAGVVIGLFSGYLGRVLDTILSRFMDVVLSLPYLIFAIALISLVDQGYPSPSRSSRSSHSRRWGASYAGRCCPSHRRSSSRRPGRLVPATYGSCSWRSCRTCSPR